MAVSGEEDPNYSLRDEFIGHTAQDLAKRLAGTKAGETTQEQSAAPDMRNSSCS
ncbi:hypothetical protein [Streptomyces sp. NPDC029041]|uniref:hypothetical protein n=1 Tax=Streptomyces sp. NPDC029041 TaxID=3155727 RepID=UPI0033EBD848